MNKKIIPAIILIVGVIISLMGGYGLFSSEGLTNGLTTMFIGYPLVLIGIIWLLITVFRKNKNINNN